MRSAAWLLCGGYREGDAAVLRFAVCDDEPVMLEALSGLLTEYMEQRRSPAFHISRFRDGDGLLESGGDFDLILLDIQMPRPDGMETARLLRLHGYRGLLIFTTVLKECVFDAFAVQAFDYLVKPLDTARFRQTMDRALLALKQRESETLLVQTKYSRRVVPLSQIVYCEVLGRKIYLHQKDGGITDYYGRMEDLEHRLDSRFFRCHRSYLINLDELRECGAGRALLSQGAEVPVSRLRERDLTQALLRHLREEDCSDESL